MSDIVLRPARRSDAADLAILDNLAGHGISLWFWMKDHAGDRLETAIAYGRSRLQDGEVLYGWTNTVVATDRGDCVQGAVNSYKLPEIEEDEADIKRNAPSFVPVFELFGEAVGHWLIDSLAVYPDVQGQGVGGLLLEDSLRRAQQTGSRLSSLVVEDSNTSAIKLYNRFGFNTADSRPFVAFDGYSKTKQWLLMTAQL